MAGGGAVEAALSIYLDSFATTLGTREQLAIAEFSQALLVIPKTLAVNAALDATDVVSQLCMYHNTAQKVVWATRVVSASFLRHPFPPLRCVVIIYAQRNTGQKRFRRLLLSCCCVRCCGRP